MHSRRISAFLMGGWLLGSILVAFVTSQSLANVDRLIYNPTPALILQMGDLDRVAAGNLLHYGAVRYNRHVTSAWEFVQLGVGASLLAVSILTVHRSRTMIAGTALMLVIAATMAFWVTPSINSIEQMNLVVTGRNQQFVDNMSLAHKVLEVFKCLLGVVLTGRLLRDSQAIRANGFESMRRRKTASATSS